MKVIKKGRKKVVKPWSREYECTGKGYRDDGCGAILLAITDDLYTIRRYYSEDSNPPIVTFTCPECGVETEASGGRDMNKMPSKAEWLKSH